MFRPWIGRRYGRHYGSAERNAFGALDVLVVGESHYSDSKRKRRKREQADPDFTRQVVQRWGIDGASEDGYYFKRIARVLCWDRHASDVDCAEIWEDVAFCNLVGRLMKTRHERPSGQDFAEGAKALKRVLRVLRSDVVLVTGRRTWSHVQPLADGADGRFGWIYHPAAGGGQFKYRTAIPAFQALCEG